MLRSITAYRDTEALFGRDGDNSGLDYNGDVHDEDHEQFSQEFQLASQGNEHLNWIAGLYYFEEETERPHAARHGGRPLRCADCRSVQTTRSSAPLYLARYAFDFTIDFDNHQKTTDYAAYFHGDYAFADRWTLGFGLRYTNEEKEFRQAATRVASQTPLLIPTDPVTGQPIFTPANRRLRPATNAPTSMSRAASNCEADWDDLSGEVESRLPVDRRRLRLRQVQPRLPQRRHQRASGGPDSRWSRTTTRSTSTASRWA